MGLRRARVSVDLARRIVVAGLLWCLIPLRQPANAIVIGVCVCGLDCGHCDGVVDCARHREKFAG
jgi:hypothetical protein